MTNRNDTHTHTHTHTGVVTYLYTHKQASQNITNWILTRTIQIDISTEILASNFEFNTFLPKRLKKYLLKLLETNISNNVFQKEK